MNVERRVMAATVARIESCPDASIESIVRALPEDAMIAAEREAIIGVLKTRRFLVRGAVEQKGWLP